MRREWIWWRDKDGWGIEVYAGRPIHGLIRKLIHFNFIETVKCSWNPKAYTGRGRQAHINVQVSTDPRQGREGEK